MASHIVTNQLGFVAQEGTFETFERFLLCNCKEWPLRNEAQYNLAYLFLINDFPTVKEIYSC